MPTGRYAPSPTGSLHLGNLRTAVAAWLFARVDGSPFRLRWDDLDETADPRHETEQLADFAALGIDFDGEPLRQSTRLDEYRDIISTLVEAGHTYRCWCSRRDIREAAAAPHGVPGAYPGTCRTLTAVEIAEREASGKRPAIRLRTNGEVVTVVDSLHGRHRRPMDDIVLQRGDGIPAYNLVVVIDDDAQGVREVVRGADLLDSTPRHAYLQRVLGIVEPRWTHVPLVVDGGGDRLAKRDGSAGLAAWIAAGGTTHGLIAAIGRSLGVPVGSRASLPELLAEFDPRAVPMAPTVFRPEGPELSLGR